MRAVGAHRVRMITACGQEHRGPSATGSHRTPARPGGSLNERDLLDQPAARKPHCATLYGGASSEELLRTLAMLSYNAMKVGFWYSGST
jgi:hypothetical protein